jgi:chemotaxis protein methyltransferase WspC
MKPLARIEALLSRRIGLNRSSIGRSLELAIEARMAASGATDRAAFADRLERDSEELQALVEQIVVPETWFFRDEQPFRFLARWVASEASRSGSGRVFRVLSIPCSTGEEPYSIAITLLDRGLPAASFSIDAVDVSRCSLARAREGRYGRKSFRATDLGFRARHLSADGDQYRVSDAIRERVRFLEGNLVDASLLVQAAPYDVIFCRNILIYLDRPARDAALAALDRLLVDGGILIAGHADGIDTQDGRFRTLSEPGAFAYQRAPRETSAPRARIAPAKTAPAIAAPPHEKHPLEVAAELANADRFGEAATICEAQLGRDPSEPHGYALLGAIRVAEGHLEAAEDCFQRALYLDRDHYDSLVQLALLCDRRGDSKAAARMRRRAKRAAQGTATE